MQMRLPISVCAILMLAAVYQPCARGGDKGKTDAAKVEAAMAEGKAAAQRRDYVKAIAAFEKADKSSHHTCANCLLELFQAQRRGGYMMDALDTAKKAIKAAGDDKALAAQAYLLRGVLLSDMATKPTDKKHAEAAADMRQAIALNPSDAIEHYDLGYELMKQGSDDAGIAELRAYIASAAANPRLADKAREMIGDPRRAREQFAPDFAFTSLEGKTISLVNLHGKVGLLDFWGTWCPPCRESIPSLVRLHKEFAGQPVEFVGISSDSDEQAWRAFIAKNGMSWPEYLDSSNAMQNTFGVDSFPTYFVLNRDGVIRFRQSGWGEDMAMMLEDAIKKALKEKPEAGGSVAANANASSAAQSAATAVAGGVEKNDAAIAAPQRMPIETSGVRPSIVVTPAGASAPAPTSSKATAANSGTQSSLPFYGSISGDIYENAFFGLTLTLPNGWIAASAAAIGAGNDRISADVRKFAEQHIPGADVAHIVGPKVILYASAEGVGDGSRKLELHSILISVVEWNGKLSTGFIEGTDTTMKKFRHLELDGKATDLLIGGHEFFRADYRDLGWSQPAWLSRWQTAEHGYLITIEVRAASRSELDELGYVVQSIVFRSPAEKQ